MGVIQIISSFGAPPPSGGGGGGGGSTDRTLISSANFGNGSLNTTNWQQTLSGTPTVTVDSLGVMHVTGGPNTFFGSQWVYQAYKTLLSDFKVSVDIIANDKQSGNAAFLGGGISTRGLFNTNNVDVVFCMSDGGAARTGKLIYNSDQGSADSSSALTYSVGDTIRLTYEKHNKIFTCTAQNITTSSAIIFISADEGGAGSTGIGEIFGGGGFGVCHIGGDMYFKNMAVTTKTVLHPYCVIAGDSIGCGAAATVAAKYWRYVVQDNYPARTFGYFVAGGSKLADHQNTYKARLIELAPTKLIIALGMNDVIAGTSTSAFQTDLSAMIADHQANGSIVYLCKITPNDTTDVSPWNTAIINAAAAASPACTVIDMNTPLRGTGFAINASYHYDGIHPNDAGQLVMGNTFNSAGILT